MIGTMRRTAFGAAALLTALAAARPASAQETPPAPRFGDRGQLIVTADRLLPIFSFTSQTTTSIEGAATTKITDSGTSIAFLVGHEPTLGAVHTIPRLAVDVTVSKRLTIGSSFAFAFGLAGSHTEVRTAGDGTQTTRDASTPRATILGFAPRGGYVLPLGPHFAFWPRAGFAFYSVRTRSEQTNSASNTPASTDTDTLFSLDLDPQLVWQPLPHVLLHVGPLVNIPLTGSHETSFSQGADAKDRSDDLSVFHIGLSAGLGAWFDL
jgi:hypothetical protein